MNGTNNSNPPSLEGDYMLLYKVALQSATCSGCKRHELVYHMLNELDRTIWVHRVSSITHGDAFTRSLVAFEIPKITNQFGDGWNKEFKVLQIKDGFGDG